LEFPGTVMIRNVTRTSMWKKVHIIWRPFAVIKDVIALDKYVKESPKLMNLGMRVWEASLQEGSVVPAQH
jgi:hypothetical protein